MIAQMTQTNTATPAKITNNVARSDAMPFEGFPAALSRFNARAAAVKARATLAILSMAALYPNPDDRN